MATIPFQIKSKRVLYSSYTGHVYFREAGYINKEFSLGNPKTMDSIREKVYLFQTSNWYLNCRGTT